MELPTARELELETLLRTRDNQLAELSDEVNYLRQSLATEPGPSTSDPVTLPPALVSVLLPHLHAASATAPGATSASNTVTAALTQRARLLQEENDELYDLLKQGETGKLKEEVRGLRRVVERLEGALRESHQVITSLSTELDKSYETFMASARASNSVNNHKSYSRSPRTAYNPLPHPTDNGTTASSKLPPTGPRAHKKPRMSEAQASPPLRGTTALPAHKNHAHAYSAAREHAPRRSSDGRGRPNHAKMEVEEDQRARPPSPGLRDERDRDRDRDRERDRGNGAKRREREREPRDGHRAHKYDGGAGRGAPGRRPERLSFSNESASSADRTLAERMGL